MRPAILAALIFAAGILPAAAGDGLHGRPHRVPGQRHQDGDDCKVCWHEEHLPACSFR